MQEKNGANLQELHETLLSTRVINKVQDFENNNRAAQKKGVE